GVQVQVSRGIELNPIRAVDLPRLRFDDGYSNQRRPTPFQQSMDLEQRALRIGHVLEGMVQHDEMILSRTCLEGSFHKPQPTPEVLIPRDEWIEARQAI